MEVAEAVGGWGGGWTSSLRPTPGAAACVCADGLRDVPGADEGIVRAGEEMALLVRVPGEAIALLVMTLRKTNQGPAR